MYRYVLYIVNQYPNAGFRFNSNDVKDMDTTVNSYHKMVEAMKFGFGKRSSLGDEAHVDITEVGCFNNY